MIEKKLQFSGMESVKRFVSLTERQSFDVDLQSGRHQIDAKSILGIFSLNIEQPLLLRVHGSGEEQQQYLEELAPYLLEAKQTEDARREVFGMGCDVLALGELLVHFTLNGESAQGHQLYEANPGGAPVTVLAMLARLGRRTTFIGKLGDDLFGRQLSADLSAAGVDLRGLVMDTQAKTPLAFVKTTPDGSSDFVFYRDPGADEMLCAEELDAKLLASTRIFHFGSLSMTREPVRSATRRAVDLAKSAGAMISFDPNLRAPLWASLDDAKEQILWGCGACDVLKMSDAELVFLTDCKSPEDGAASLLRRFPNLRLLTVTHGAHGSTAYCGGIQATQKAFDAQLAIDTTGAGDTFCSCCLDYLLDHDPDTMVQEQLNEMLRFASAAAALITRRKGALHSIPSPEEIHALLAAAKNGQ